LRYLVIYVLTSWKAKIRRLNTQKHQEVSILLQTHLELEHPSNLDIMVNPSGTEDHNQNGGYISLIANNGKSTAK
jgi:hypothetical protein